MAPVHIERLESIGDQTRREITKVEANKMENINLVKPDGIQVHCDPNDTFGLITPNLPEEVITVTKFSSENDTKGIKIDVTRRVDVRGPQIVVISSPFFGETYRIRHIPPRKDLYMGKLPRQPA